jgi:NADPH-dependent 2,4-dienoyl-CoA reductase/sulfur reductase-like enzyme
MVRGALLHNGCRWATIGLERPRLRALADAIRQLHAQHFPEFTGRLCPAPCEASCVLEIREGDAVTIKQIENSIVNRAWDEGWIVPVPPRRETGRSVAVVGAGPAGMAAAQQLRRAGHRVVLYERDEAGGGLVRFGVPGLQDRSGSSSAAGPAARRGRRGALRRRRRRRRHADDCAPSSTPSC